MGDGLNRARHGSDRNWGREQYQNPSPASASLDDSHLTANRTGSIERKIGLGNIYCQKSQGTLLDKWKEYTQGEDEESIIENIYTPHTSSGECSVVVAKKDKMPSEQSREKLRDLRIKAMAREQEELDTTQTQFTSQQVIIKYDTQDAGGQASGGNFYAMPKGKSLATGEEPVSDDESHGGKKEQWYKKARKIFLQKH
ncbi:uncharacterized protein LOC134819087 isoform X2 [Bolinopsis microptera]|uniref:uncharacterized protein LOC134819087 isoform X2 n=1 Tax=Bolinopsis microptera TaxID=2820187 RepID=UPI00307A117A